LKKLLGPERAFAVKFWSIPLGINESNNIKALIDALNHVAEKSP
jgi:hypothetical protein